MRKLVSKFKRKISKINRSFYRKNSQLLLFLLPLSFIFMVIVVFVISRTQLYIKPDNDVILGIGSGTKYYVDFTGGSDSNNGTSTSTPWKTLAKASAATFGPGDILHLKRGETWNEKLEISSSESGTASDPVVIRAYGTGARPHVMNTTVHDGTVNQRYRAIYILADYYIIEDLKVSQATYSAIEFGVGAQHNVVQNSEIFNAAIGVRIKDGFNTVRSNYIHDLVMAVNDDDPLNPLNDYGALGISIEGSNNLVDGTLIEKNVVKNCQAESNDYGIDGGFVEFFGEISNTIIRYNYTENNKGFTEVGGPSDGADRTVSNTLIHHNVSKNNLGRFVLFNGGSNQYRANVTNFKVENNTIYDRETAVSPIYFQTDTAIANEFYFKNNFVYAGAQFVEAGMTESFLARRQNNIYARWRYLRDGNGVIINDAQGNPIKEEAGSTGFTSLGTGEVTRTVAQMSFVDVANGNFNITSSSAAINAGQNLGYTLDFTGTAIPQSGGVDVGAFEYASEANLLANITVTESGGTTSITEGSTTDTISVKLNSMPTHDVTVNFTISGQATLSSNSLTFTTSNWSQDQSIIITAIDDTVSEGTHTATLGMATSSYDESYSEKIGPIITVNIVDNEVSDIIITQSNSNTTVTEGGATDIVGVRLTALPAADVTINISFGPDLTASPTSLLFTTANWNIDQNITVSAVDDSDFEDTHTDTLTFTSTSTDENYNNTVNQSVTVTITDNDFICTNFTYTEWTACIDGVRTRSVLSSSPNQCTGGSPITEEACSLQLIVCGPIDVNGDSRITFADFGNFVRAYGKMCSDTPPTTGCGPMDVNQNGKIDFTDFASFIERYNKLSCVL